MSMPHRSRRRRDARGLCEPLEPRTLLALAPIGPEFLVPETTFNDQLAPAVAADADGDFVVAWSSVEPNGSLQVRAQPFDALGQPQGFFGELRMGFNVQGEPSVAVDGDGDFVVVWQAVNADGNGSGIIAQRFTPQPIAESVSVVNTQTTGDQTAPAVAMDAQGNFVVVWSGLGLGKAGGGRPGIFARRFDAAGTPIGEQFTVDDDFPRGSEVPTAPAVAMDADGDFVVTWHSRIQSFRDRSTLWARRFDRDGVAQGAQLWLDEQAGVADQEFPAVAMDADGDFVVAWEDTLHDAAGRAILARRFDANGNPLAPRFRANTTTAGDQRDAAVTTDADGDFVIGWTSAAGQDGSGAGAYAQRYSAAGLPLGTEFRLNTHTSSDQSMPALAMDADGDLVAAWQSAGQDGAGSGIYAQRYDESTDTAGPTVTALKIAGERVQPDARLVHSSDQLVLNFSELLSTVGGTTGGASATNPNNYRLIRTSAPVGSSPFIPRITFVQFALDPTERQYETTLFLSATLPDGDYELDVLDTLRDPAGNALDSNLDGIPGGGGAPGATPHTIPFSIRRPVPLGDEFRVNRDTVNSQGSPAVAMNAAAGGGYIVAWTGLAPDGSSDVYAQRYSAAGIPLADPFVVNTTRANSQAVADVAFDGTGNFVVVWSGNGPGDNSGVFLQRFDAAGDRVGPESRVNTYTLNTQAFPAIAADAAGNFVIAWQSFGQDGDANGIYARRFNAAGNPLDPQEFRPHNTTAGAQALADIAMDSDGDFVITWSSGLASDPDNGTDVFARRYSAAGVPATAAEFPVNLGTNGFQHAPAVAMDADGDFVIVYINDVPTVTGAHIDAQRFTATGERMGNGSIRVSHFSMPVNQNPSIAMDADGNFVIAWDSFTDAASGTDVYARQYSSAGIALGERVRINTHVPDTQRSPAIARNADGDFVIAWESDRQDGSGFGVYAQRYGANERPVALGIPSVNVQEDEADTLINLFPAFDDSTDSDDLLTYSVAGNTNLSLFSSVNITTGPTSAILRLNYAPGRSGTAVLTIRATDTGGLIVETPVTVNVIPDEPPSVTAAEFLFDTAQHRLRFVFSQNVQTSLTAAQDLRVEKLGAGGGPIPFAEPAYFAATNTAIFSFPGGILPEGNYRATLLAAGINAVGVPMDADYVHEFSFFIGDANADRRINADDYFRIDQNFLAQPASPTYAQGDFNYDGTINADDYFLIDRAFLSQSAPLAAQLTPSQAPPRAAAANVAVDDQSVAVSKQRTRVARPTNLFADSRTRQRRRST